jgi:flagellar motility protein MotE (MotC chaperone)
MKTEKKTNTKKSGFFKKYWHIILICLFFLLWMSKCSQSCSRGHEINSQSQVIDSLSKVNDTLKNSLNYYTTLYQVETKHNDNFTSIAVGNQTELYNQINQLEKENQAKQEEINNLKSQINVLHKEIKELKEQIEEN